jgi:alpha-N-acetylglucosaminidase
MGYTTAFWEWSRWEREIDWMAMNGINFPLAFVGQEYVWQQVFAQLGMNATAVRESWFSNAAFLPWNRMGNINNWAGPLTSDFINAQVLLQKQVCSWFVLLLFCFSTMRGEQILARERSFGMKPILPGFAGHGKRL